MDTLGKTNSKNIIAKVTTDNAQSVSSANHSAPQQARSGSNNGLQWVLKKRKRRAPAGW